MAEAYTNKELLDLITVFNGEVEYLSHFLSLVTVACRAVPAAQIEIFLGLLINSKLSNAVKDKIASHNCSTLENLKIALNKFYSLESQKSSLNWMTDLVNARQRFQETIAQYGDRVLRLFNNYINASPPPEAQRIALREANSSLLIGSFRKGLLNDKVATALSTYENADIHEVILKAEILTNELGVDNLQRNRHIGFIIKYCSYCKRNNHSDQECFFQYSGLPQSRYRFNNRPQTISPQYNQTPLRFDLPPPTLPYHNPQNQAGYYPHPTYADFQQPPDQPFIPQAPRYTQNTSTFPRIDQQRPNHYTNRNNNNNYTHNTNTAGNPLSRNHSGNGAPSTFGRH